MDCFIVNDFIVFGCLFFFFGSFRVLFFFFFVSICAFSNRQLDR